MRHLSPIRILCFCLFAVVSSWAVASDEEEWVSVINLIAAPEKYHNKKVIFTAYVIVEFENMSLCLSKNSLSSKDCLWLDIGSGEITPTWRKVSRQVAAIHGTFDKDQKGHFGGWSGGIKDVTYVNAESIVIDSRKAPPVVREFPQRKSQ